MKNASILFVIICAMVFSQADNACAQSGGNADAGKKNIAINIQLDDKMKQEMDAYKKATAALNPEQLQKLNEMRQLTTNAVSPALEEMSVNAQVDACMRSDQDMAARPDFYKEKIGKWRENQMLIRTEALGQLKVWTQSIHFIDANVLAGELDAEFKMQAMMGKGLIEAAQKASSAPPDCNKLRDEIMGPQKNVTIVSDQAGQDFETAVSRLTPEQKAKAAELDQRVALALQPSAEIIKTSMILGVCQQKYPAAKARSEKDMQNFSAWRDSMKAKKIQGYTELKNWSASLDFIDQGILQRYLQAKINAGIMAQGKEMMDAAPSLVTGPDICDSTSAAVAIH